MLIPFGILASTGGAPADFELISSSILTSTASSIEFASIPQTYKHLRLHVVGRTSTAVVQENVILLWNDQGTSNSNHRLFGNGSSVASSSNTGASAMTSFVMPGATATTSAFGAAVVDILDYKSTVKNKTVRSLFGVHSAGAGGTFVGLSSQSSYGTPSAINLLQIYPFSGGSWVSGTRISLYGIKG